MIDNAPTPTKYFLFDAESTASIDVTGAESLASLRDELCDQGIVFGIARAKGPFLSMLEMSGVADRMGKENIFPTVHNGAKTFLQTMEGSNRKKHFAVATAL